MRRETIKLHMQSRIRLITDEINNFFTLQMIVERQTLQITRYQQRLKNKVILKQADKLNSNKSLGLVTQVLNEVAELLINMHSLKSVTGEQSLFCLKTL